MIAIVHIVLELALGPAVARAVLAREDTMGYKIGQPTRPEGTAYVIRTRRCLYTEYAHSPGAAAAKLRQRLRHSRTDPNPVILRVHRADDVKAVAAACRLTRRRGW